MLITDYSPSKDYAVSVIAVSGTEQSRPLHGRLKGAFMLHSCFCSVALWCVASSCSFPPHYTLLLHWGVFYAIFTTPLCSFYSFTWHYTSILTFLSSSMFSFLPFRFLFLSFLLCPFPSLNFLFFAFPSPPILSFPFLSFTLLLFPFLFSLVFSSLFCSVYWGLYRIFILQSLAYEHHGSEGTLKWHFCLLTCDWSVSRAAAERGEIDGGDKAEPQRLTESVAPPEDANEISGGRTDVHKHCVQERRPQSNPEFALMCN